MISCKIMGRLGNQLFQIATAQSLAFDKNDSAIYCTQVIGACPSHEERTLYTSTIFSNVNYVPVIIGNSSDWEHYMEREFCYNKLPEYKKNIILEGYFQSEKYFAHNKQRLVEFFNFDRYLPFMKKFYGDLSFFQNKDLVAVHVRRGDYVKLSHVHSNLAENHDYYTTAMSNFKGKKFVFFSDDIEWCKSKFGKDNLYIESVSDISDMYIMGKIPNKIIANSSFSWWSAWLFEKNDHNIIAPKNWFENSTDTKDLIPDRWQRI